jgi:DNA-binding beta-propeller fold protein YncE
VRPDPLFANIPVGQGPSAVAVSPQTGKIYVANFIDKTGSVLGWSL